MAFAVDYPGERVLWYSAGRDCERREVITISIIENAVQWAVNIANDNSHGYSQADRWGRDYDCSSFVISAFQQAGVPVKSKGASYTGNMRIAFLACGFTDVTNRIGLASGYGLQAGDVLLNYEHHTALYIGGGKIVHARTDEGNQQPGDQSGNEIRVQAYYNYPWNCVLRYKESTAAQTATNSTAAKETTANGLSKGSSGDSVKKLQEKLISLGYSCGPDGADGVYGNNTFKAVAAFQEDNSLTVTGAVDTVTLDAINKAKPKEEDTTHNWKPALLQMTPVYSADCVVLQALLNVRHFPCGSTDGFFQSKTQAAVNKAKDYYGLEVNGICDRALWDALLKREEN